MKKVFLALLTLSLLTSCGPHRLSCGPGKRCVESSKKINFKKIEKINKQENT
jgi:hypothetical protein